MVGLELDGKRILVVEDEAAWRDELIPKVLKGAEVDAVCTVAAALRMMREKPIDGVVVDLFLRGSIGTGMQVVKAAERRGIPVVVFTNAPDFAKLSMRTQLHPPPVVDKGRLADLREMVVGLFHPSGMAATA